MLVTEISTNGTDNSLNTMCSNTENTTKPQQSICPPENLDISGNSYTRPSKWVRGEIGLPIALFARWWYGGTTEIVYEQYFETQKA